MGGVHIVSKKQDAKFSNSVVSTRTLLLTSVVHNMPTVTAEDWSSLPVELHAILLQYSHSFEVPQGLPPIR